MKKLIATLLIIFPFVAWSQQGVLCAEGQEECQFTDKLTFEIMDGKGRVVDRTTYERLWPVNYNQAMLLKYLRVFRQLEGGVKTYLDVLGENGDLEKALEDYTGR